MALWDSNQLTERVERIMRHVLPLTLVSINCSQKNYLKRVSFLVFFMSSASCIYIFQVTSKPSQTYLSPYPQGSGADMKRVDSSVSQFSERPEDNEGGEAKETW